MIGTIKKGESKNILVIGSSNTDMVVTADRLPAAGETLLGGSFLMAGGGKGANQAVAAARLGASVALICKLGNDVFGRQAIHSFEVEGIDTRYILADSELPSGVALITVDAKGENCIVVAPGANAHLLPEDLAAAEQAIGASDIILIQLEIPLETVAYVADLAFRMGKRIILNPAPALPLPADLLRCISLITPNESEAALISGVKITDRDSARAAASRIAGMGVPEVIITRGREGALIYSKGGFEEIPAFPVEVVDTTAAGDVFNGALAVALAEGQSLSGAARFASGAAALSVTRKGAQPSAPFRREVLDIMKKCLLVLVLAMAVLTSSQAQKARGLALTPPMGWNSWNTFFCSIDEKLIMQMADEMATHGMKEAGYEYVIIDDCWSSHGRDSLGGLVADPVKFPHGMKYVGDYIHAKGLKFGMYNCAGPTTCAGYPGTRGHEYQDALSYAKWGVDYLKYDWCNTGGINAEEAYTTMSKALAETGRPIVFSLCEWGTNKPWLWAKPVGHLWRTTGDISCSWVEKQMAPNWIALGVTRIIDLEAGLRQYAGPGHWNDPDMLEVGNGLSFNEDKSHFSMWAMLAAPLIAGNDLRKMSDQTRGILTNKAVIAVDQDSLGVQAFRYGVTDSVELWARPLAGGDWALCFLNRSGQNRKSDFDFTKNAIYDSLSGRRPDSDLSRYVMTDLWKNRPVRWANRMLSYVIPSHDVLMIRMSKK